MIRLLIVRGVAVLVPYIAAVSGHWAFTAFWCVGVGLLYAYEVWRRDWVLCWACKGGRRVAGGWLTRLLWPNSYRFCWRCKGHGGWVRWGTRMFRRQHAETLKVRRS